MHTLVDCTVLAAVRRRFLVPLWRLGLRQQVRALVLQRQDPAEWISFWLLGGRCVQEGTVAHGVARPLLRRHFRELSKFVASATNRRASALKTSRIVDAPQGTPLQVVVDDAFVDDIG